MTGNQWETIEGVKGDFDMLPGDLISEFGLAGDVETVGDSDELETGSCLQDLDDMEIFDPVEVGGVRDEVESISGSATLDSV